MEDSLISIISHITSTSTDEIYNNPMPTLIGCAYAVGGAAILSSYLLNKGYQSIVLPLAGRIREYYKSSNS